MIISSATASHAIHGLLGREGLSPSALLENAWQELNHYKSVSIRRTRATSINPTEDRFEFNCADGTNGIASKFFSLPADNGNRGFLRRFRPSLSVLRRFEYAGKPIAAFGKGDKGADLAVMMKHWIADVVACSDGTEISADAARSLKQHGIPLRREPTVSLDCALLRTASLMEANSADAFTGLLGRRFIGRAQPRIT
jgi:thioredoxin reductase